MIETGRFLLLQVRDQTDPMRRQEVRCFARVLRVDAYQVDVFDLLSRSLQDSDLAGVSGILVGGSGDYSATDNAAWMLRALDSLKRACDSGIPLFGSCWGFQAIARAYGGLVIQDRERAEIGTHQLTLTEAGRSDPVFAPLGSPFEGQMGHEDRVAELPESAVLLASSALVDHQAFRLADRPVYCTQFHPELNRASILERLRAYPQYADEVARDSYEAIAARFTDAPASEQLIRRFLGLSLSAVPREPDREES